MLIGAVLLGVLAAMRGTGGALAGPAAPRLPVTLTGAVHASAPPGHAARASHRGQEGTRRARPHQPGRVTRPAAHGPAAAGRANQPVAADDAARASPASPRAPGPAVPQPARPAPGGAAPPPVITLDARQHPPATAWYTVREGDNLWDIAAAHLGDAEKWPEIYALNEGRPQPDGQDLTDPALIEPGWILRLPPAPGHRPGPGPARPGRPPAGQPAAASVPATASSAAPPRRPAPGEHGDGHEAPGVSLPSGGLAGVSLAAAVAAALVIARVHRRRRYRPGKALTSRLDPPGPPVPPAIAALRRAACPPPPGAATAEADDADAYFAGQDPGPDDTGPPAPGSGPALRDAARDAGTTAAPASPPQAPPAPPGEPQPPGVIALGVRGGSEISADIAALGGLGLTGPGAPAAARAILAGLLARAVPGQPGGPAEVIMPAADTALLLPGHNRDDISGAGLPGLIITPSLDTALDQAEALIVRRARMSGSRDTGDDPPGDAAAPPLPAAALIASPARAASARLAAVLQAGQSAGVAGILLGDWPPGITCHVDADGAITSADRSLDGIRLFHLGDADTTAVISLLREACGTPAGEYDPAPVPGEPPPSWPATDPRPAPGGLPPPAPGTEASQDPAGDIPAGAGTAPRGGGASPAARLPGTPGATGRQRARHPAGT